ncbi:sulfotransferase domain-containing protein [Deefgea sp. CFH1-16]|uniref:sulfotransferase domain-containing protein n=1 Tax=Deefgea sp. CFH1-16 TaxID=2675457 RepID=UPI0015F413C1|nr:sulfotransferase domain-containing protein [Deefgea sp. CFH1-16]MBM5574153.1 hypothetical protein [Deefgea sp. CFH1-16]
MMPSKAFSGRVIFDHLPKTAGQAINAWLIEELGSGSVTPNLIGAHQDLIRQYGGIYSIISAHIQFDIQEALDPRYQYITVFREPVERVVSWLYFVINNHDDTQLPETRAEAIQVLQSNGRDIPSPILNHISNGYVEHFCRINGTGLESDSEKVANAFLIIQQYDAVGLFHEIPQFLADVSQLISIPMQKEIARVNVTNKRPEVKKFIA